MPKYLVTLRSGHEFRDIEASNENAAKDLVLNLLRTEYNEPEKITNLEVASVELEESKIGVNRMEKIKEADRVQKDKDITVKFIQKEISNMKDFYKKSDIYKSLLSKANPENLIVGTAYPLITKELIDSVWNDLDESILTIQEDELSKEFTDANKWYDKGVEEGEKSTKTQTFSLNDVPGIVPIAFQKDYLEGLKDGHAEHYRESILTIQEEVTVGDIILEKGDSIKILVEKELLEIPADKEKDWSNNGWVPKIGDSFRLEKDIEAGLPYSNKTYLLLPKGTIVTMLEWSDIALSTGILWVGNTNNVKLPKGPFSYQTRFYIDPSSVGPKVRI